MLFSHVHYVRQERVHNFSGSESVLPVSGPEWFDVVDVECLSLDLSLGEILGDVVRFETLDSQLNQLLQGELKEKRASCIYAIICPLLEWDHRWRLWGGFHCGFVEDKLLKLSWN